MGNHIIGLNKDTKATAEGEWAERGFREQGKLKQDLKDDQIALGRRGGEEEEDVLGRGNGVRQGVPTRTPLPLWTG